MLLRFRFSNFRSFRDEQELSLVAASALKETPESVVFRPTSIKEGVLPVAAIFGANASGKTNLMRALAFFVRAVADSHNHWKPDAKIPFEPFLGAPEGQSSVFEIDFLLTGIRHSYGFRIDSTSIIEEWLHAYPKAKKQALFHRSKGRPMAFSAKLGGPNRLIESLTRKNSLFLSAAAQNNQEALSKVFQWITQRSLFVDAALPWSMSGPGPELWTESLYARVATNLLRAADIGILNMVAEKVEVDGDAKRIMTAVAAAIGEDEPPKEIVRVRLAHRVGEIGMLFDEDQESKGTTAYLRILAPVLTALRYGSLICVDELDSSLHPLLTARILGIFMDPAVNTNGAQLVFNTHDSTLLSRTPLRRDEIWFTEKTPDGSSVLYPLTDYKPRKEVNLETAYLNGLYGAVPMIDTFDISSDRGKP